MVFLAQPGHIGGGLHAELAQRAQQVTQRQADHVGEAPVCQADRAKAAVLDRVTARLVERSPLAM